jgi:hypothetical protein
MDMNYLDEDARVSKLLEGNCVIHTAGREFSPEKGYLIAHRELGMSVLTEQKTRNTHERVKIWLEGLPHSAELVRSLHQEAAISLNVVTYVESLWEAQVIAITHNVKAFTSVQGEVIPLYGADDE